MRTGMIVSGIILWTVTAWPSTLYGQVDWTKYHDNPVLDVGEPGEWDDLHVGSGHVMRCGDVYRMWYSGQDGSKTRIGLTVSYDGINWTKYEGNPVLDADEPWEERGPAEPTVLYDGFVYHMWYSGDDASGFDSIGYATSPDGINWTKHPDNPVFTEGEPGSWDDNEVYAPSVVLVGDTYHLYYTAGSPNRIGHATSIDGIDWVRDGNEPVLDVGPAEWDSGSVERPFVIYDDGLFRMWYGGQAPEPQIGYATSVDGSEWVKYGDNPVIEFGENGTWDDHGLNGPAVVRFGNEYHMWYAGDSPEEIRVGYAFDLGCAGDTNGDGVVDFEDILNVLSDWGMCP